MALINRISRLIKTDFHAVLDQIEEPEQMLKQAIRDMEDELTITEQRIALGAHEQENICTRKREIEEDMTELGQELDLCFESGKDNLARSLIRKKLETGRLLKRFNSRCEVNQKQLEEQRTLCDENRATLERLRQKAELFEQHAPSPASGFSDADDLFRLGREMTVTDEEVDIALLREKNARRTS